MNKLNNSHSQTLKRNFIIGEEWLYYKFYSGPKTADVILTEMIKPITEELLANHLIDGWFFIRYGDPRLHTRVRFHMKEPGAIAPTINIICKEIVPYMNQDMIWRVQLDTYQREVERYGINSMILAEKLFFHDSQMIVNMLSLIEGDEGERIRWLFGLRAVDTMLDDFFLNRQQKFDIITQWADNFGREHGMNRNLKVQLEKKFRRDRENILEVLNPDNDEKSEMLPLFEMIKQKSMALQPIVKEILELDKNQKLYMPLTDLLGSFSHMMINRLFKSKQRTHEMVLYDFLHRHYKSQLARQKYSEINKKKEVVK